MRRSELVAAAAVAFGIAALPAVPAPAKLLEHGRTCSSQYRGRTDCPMDTRGGVHIKRQLSTRQCVRDRNYFVRAHGVLVRDGCRPMFVRNHWSHNHRSLLDPRRG